MVLIAQISDLHLRPRGVPALRVSETNMFAERAIERLRTLDPRPDAVIITGDLADKGTPKEYETLHLVLRKLDTPWYAVSGNHDHRDTLKTALADHDWARQYAGPQLCFAVDIGPVRLIGLDSSIPGKAHGELGADQCAWLDERLADEPDKPTLVALHHPPIETGIRHMDRTMLRDAAELEAVLARHDQVDRILCGHQHRPILATFAARPLVIAPGIAHQVVFDLTEDGRSAFNFEPPAFLVHKWTAATGFVTHMAYVETFPGPYPFWPDKDRTWP